MYKMVYMKDEECLTLVFWLNLGPIKKKIRGCGYKLKVKI